MNFYKLVKYKAKINHNKVPCHSKITKKKRWFETQFFGCTYIDGKLLGKSVWQDFLTLYGKMFRDFDFLRLSIGIFSDRVTWHYDEIRNAWRAGPTAGCWWFLSSISQDALLMQLLQKQVKSLNCFDLIWFILLFNIIILAKRNVPGNITNAK